MCRHLARLGPARTLEAILLTPPHGLLRQSWAPRHQRHGTVNADGFGVGWWQPAVRPEPARYRSTAPMWADRSFASLAGVVLTEAVVAAVRSATPPLPVEESGCAPFTDGHWLFSHNGAVGGWAGGANVVVRRMVSTTRAAAIEGATDSEVLFALTLDRLHDGCTAAEALAAVVGEMDRIAGGRLNLLLCDGQQIVATTWGDTLFTRTSGGGVEVASEPSDDDGAWTAVPDRSLVEATLEGITIRGLGPSQRHTELESK
jgi:glutamine amidotransferase